MRSLLPAPASAARPYSGTVGGIALCQVAVTLTYATGRGHAPIGRALYLPEGCAADEEHRYLAGVPDEAMFATKPQLASALLDRAQSLGIRAAFVAGDEVYGGRQLRRDTRWTAICLLAYIYLAVAVAMQRQHDAGADLDAGLIPITIPELLRLLRDTVIPPPRRDRAHRLHWSTWRRRHQHRARQAHQRWNAHAETTP